MVASLTVIIIMNKALYLIAVVTVVALSLVLAECSGRKTGEEAALLDVERIASLSQKGGGEMTPGDCDFLLEQCEVIVGRVEGMMADEYKAYPETLSEEEQHAFTDLCRCLITAQDNGRFSDSQLTRLGELYARMPGGD